jgi:spore coat protein A
VEQRYYRFRILNGSQARFYNLQLYYAHSKDSGEANLRQPGSRIIQIGNEAGFIPFPVALNNPPAQFSGMNDADGNPIALRHEIQLADGPSRARRYHHRLQQRSGRSKTHSVQRRPGTLPQGDPLNDYFTGDPDQTPFGGAPSTPPGYGPNTRTLMQFQVVPCVGPADPAWLGLPEALAVHGANQLGKRIDGVLPKFEKLEMRNAVRVRDLTLNETFDDYGRLIQLLGNNQVQDTVNGEFEFGPGL